MLLLPAFIVPASLAEAKAAQDTLSARVEIKDCFDLPRTIAGVDVGYDVPSNLAHASIVVVSFDRLQLLEQVQAYVPVEFPYVPGFLSFREIPAILAALAQLNAWPDMVMVDGQGIAHPRRLGIAAHLGVLLDRPTIGVAKSRLVGGFDMPGPKKGERSDLTYKGEVIGAVLRSRDNTKPLFISPGHRVSVESAVRITLQCLTRYRLPEPTRLADKYSKCAKRLPLLENMHPSA